MIARRTPRWALSFADLCLLLLGFFVILHARASDGRATAEGLRAAFGAKPAPPAAVWRAETLFEPGQAVLLSARKGELAALGRRAARRGATVTVESRGVDSGTRRFDAWELAAARTAAIARAIRAGGLDERRIAIVLPPSRTRGQTVTVLLR